MARLIHTIAPGRRGALIQSAVSFQPSASLEASITNGELRSAFADYWEAQKSVLVPIAELRAALASPVPIRTVLEFNKFALVEDALAVETQLEELVEHLSTRILLPNASTQQRLFLADAMPSPKALAAAGGTVVTSLTQLTIEGRKFSTIYADPPWPYQNVASRAAAVNHYPTMPLEDICREPVRELVEKDAHLHLWTTNAFLRDAFTVIDAWGFKFKSCLIWTKGDIGMGNYWRVSHEFLLLGVRGSCTFRDRTLPSWIHADRTSHSRKPGMVRSLIERASPGPYLELYGREELPNSAWTVYGNEVEPRFF